MSQSVPRWLARRWLARRWLVPLSVSVGSGGVLALATFVPIWWVQLCAFVCIAPVFVMLKGRSSADAYVIGLCFFAAWLLPTTYWYYTFMPWWLAVLASVGFVTLIANVFRIFALYGCELPELKLPGFVLPGFALPGFTQRGRRRFPFALTLALVVAVWFALTFARLHLPVLENWWIPHLGYAVWRNSGILAVTHFGGEAALEALVVMVNAALAWFAVAGRRAGAVATGVGALALVVAADLWTWRAPEPDLPRIAAIQQMTSGGVDVPANAADVERLRASSRAALGHRGDSKPTRSAGHSIVVWPENALPENLRANVGQSARDLGAAIVYDTADEAPGQKATGGSDREQTDGADDGERRYKRVVLVDAAGKHVLSNSKLHIAPDDEATDGRYSKQSAILNGLRVTAYACYDMHYPDSVDRTKDADAVFVPINDAAYGVLQRQFHKADLAFRAVQSHSTIVAAGTSGPTAVIMPSGTVVRELPYGEDGSVVFPG